MAIEARVKIVFLIFLGYLKLIKNCLVFAGDLTR
jgi:hypothetical protein